MYRIEYLDGNGRNIGRTWYSQLTLQRIGLDGLVWAGMARLNISARAASFRLYWPHETMYEYCGSI